jgi:hypothetical protein
MTKGKGATVMSKDYFMRQRSPSADVASKKSEETKPTPSVDAQPVSGPPLAKLAFNGAASRRGTLGAGSQIMSKDYFRVRPTEGDGSSPPAAPSPPAFRRAETWAAGQSADEVTSPHLVRPYFFLFLFAPTHADDLFGRARLPSYESPPLL